MSLLYCFSLLQCIVYAIISRPVNNFENKSYEPVQNSLPSLYGQEIILFLYFVLTGGLSLLNLFWRQFKR